MMYTTVRHASKYGLDDEDDCKEYEKILNDPLCTIIAEKVEKTREEEFHPDSGRLSRSFESLWRIVTWDEKKLLV